MSDDLISIDARSFRKLFAKEVYELLSIVNQEGFTLTLVGGAVRDWLLTNELPYDLDFEVRHEYEYDEEEWVFRLNRLGERLREIYQYNVEFLSFSIMRISWKDFSFDVELGSARLEQYPEQSDYGHSDFEAKLVSHHPYDETFKRRDFTINAMGIELGEPHSENEFSFIDPYGGHKDLSERILRPCGDQFAKDPVRFCRAIRFAKLYSCQFSKELEEQFTKVNLSQLSDYYFFREAFKGDFFQFSDLFFSLVKEYEIEISSSLSKLSFLEGKGKFHLMLKNAEQVLMYLVIQEDCSNQELQDFCLLGKIKKGHIGTFQNLKDILEKLQGLDKKEIKRLSSQPFSSFKENDLISQLLRFNQVMAKNSKEDIAPLGRINSTLYKQFQALYDVVPGALGGKELFEEMISSGSIAPSDRGKLALYCHLQ